MLIILNVVHNKMKNDNTIKMLCMRIDIGEVNEFLRLTCLVKGNFGNGGSQLF